MHHLALDASKEGAKSMDVDKAVSGVFPRRPEQQMPGLIPAQHIIDEIRVDGDLSPRLLLSGPAPFDEAGDNGSGAESPLHEVGFGEPGIKIIAEHVFIEQPGEAELAGLDHQREIAHRPGDQRIFAGDEAQRPRAPTLEPTSKEHAQGLVREASLERVAHEIGPIGTREGLDQHLIGLRNQRLPSLQRQPVAYLLRQRRPGAGIAEELADPLRQISREREFSSLV